MAVTNAYASLDQVTAALGINDTDEDAYLEVCINAASRSIDKYVGAMFWVDPTVATHYKFPTDSYSLPVEEGISTATGLIVKTDTAGDGTFETTLTINVDFLLRPVDALTKYPIRPYTELYSINGVWPMPTTGRPGVEITAKFGWPEVPADINLACILLAKDYAKAKDAAFGVAGSNEFGAIRIRQNQTVTDLLNPYKPVQVA
jgi:hypothetical protein